MNGIPIPYLLRNDTWIVGLFFFCIFCVSFAILGNGKNLFRQLAILFSTNKNIDQQGVHTKIAFLCEQLLLVQTCIIFGVIVLYLFQSKGTLPQEPLMMIAITVVFFYLFYLIKGLLFSFVNSIFFDKKRRLLWSSTYYSIIQLTGIALLPLFIAILFLNLPHYIYYLYFIIVMACNKIALLKRCFQIFFSKSDCSSSFILYFCALELIPCLLAVFLLIGPNSLLTIKF